MYFLELLTVIFLLVNPNAGVFIKGGRFNAHGFHNYTSNNNNPDFIVLSSNHTYISIQDSQKIRMMFSKVTFASLPPSPLLQKSKVLCPATLIKTVLTDNTYRISLTDQKNLYTLERVPKINEHFCQHHGSCCEKEKDKSKKVHCKEDKQPELFAEFWFDRNQRLIRYNKPYYRNVSKNCKCTEL